MQGSLDSDGHDDVSRRRAGWLGSRRDVVWVGVCVCGLEGHHREWICLFFSHTFSLQRVVRVCVCLPFEFSDI